MRLSPDFSPLEPGEIDNFAFNITADVGDASVFSTAWTCSLMPYQPGTDPNPQSRIVEFSNPTSIDVKLPNNTITTLYGNFVVAQVGPCPQSAAGSIYVIDALVTLTDGRVLGYNNVFKCVAPGDCT